MIVYRLSRSKYADDLSGKGAEIAGGRWNNRGTPMIYTAANRALCVAEIAVHTPLGIIPHDYKLITLEFPEKLASALDVSCLEPDWNDFPPTEATQQIGDRFIREGRSLALKVPSAVVNGEFNFLINPRHRDISQLRILENQPFSFDKRLFSHR